MQKKQRSCGSTYNLRLLDEEQARRYVDACRNLYDDIVRLFCKIFIEWYNEIEKEKKNEDIH